MAAPRPLILTQNKAHMSNTSSFADFKNQVELEKISSPLATELLDCVVNIDKKGKKRILELIANKPAEGSQSIILMRARSTVKHFSSKQNNIAIRLEINDLSPLEAAVLQGDFHLVNLFRDALPDNQKHEAGLQIKEIMFKADFLSAFKTLQKANLEYLKRYDELEKAGDLKTINELWEQIGEAQKISNFVLQVFRNPVPHQPFPDFTKEPERASCYEIDDNGFKPGDLDLDSFGRGTTLALYKGGLKSAQAVKASWAAARIPSGPQIDSKAIDLLYKVIIEQLNKTQTYLLQYPKAPIEKSGSNQIASSVALDSDDIDKYVIPYQLDSLIMNHEMVLNHLIQSMDSKYGNTKASVQKLLSIISDFLKGSEKDDRKTFEKLMTLQQDYSDLDEFNYLVGFCYLRGFGVQANHEKAQVFYEKAALHQYSPALGDLSVIHGLGFNGVRRLDYSLKLLFEAVFVNGNIEKAEIRKDACPISIHHLATAYLTGTLFYSPVAIKLNPKLAADLLNFSINKNFAPAKAEVGLRLFFGETFKQDKKQGFEYILQAARQKDPSAVRFLICLYSKGLITQCRKINNKAAKTSSELEVHINDKGYFWLFFHSFIYRMLPMAQELGEIEILESYRQNDTFKPMNQFMNDTREIIREVTKNEVIIKNMFLSEKYVVDPQLNRKIESILNDIELARIFKIGTGLHGLHKNKSSLAENTSTLDDGKSNTRDSAADSKIGHETSFIPKETETTHDSFVLGYEYNEKITQQISLSELWDLAWIARNSDPLTLSRKFSAVDNKEAASKPKFGKRD